MQKKRWITLVAVVCLLALAAGCSASGKKLDAVYLGVENYGAEGTNADTKNDFRYRFEIKGAEQTFAMANGTADADGNYDYPLQNLLKEGYEYRLTVVDGTVTDVREIPGKAEEYAPAVSGVPGERTLKNLLQTALSPVGTTLYIYGGGWDWQDVGSAIQARTLGVSADWRRFFLSQDGNYTYKDKDGDEANADPANSYYPYGGYNEYYYAGLDCSGYLGWVVYNTFETESGKDGYVGGSTGFAKRLAGKGWGTWTQDVKVSVARHAFPMKPGDVMSINGHVWLSLGTCGDGSVVIVHSTPSPSRTGQPGGGVQISAIGTDKSCDAYKLADKVMAEHYPEWYARYPVHLCDPAVYFTFEGENAGKFTWDTASGAGLTDPDGLQNMTAEQVLAALFG